MAPGPLDCVFLWSVTTPDSLLQGVIRPHDPVGWELCVLQDEEVVVRETFFSEDQAREYGEALRRRLEPLLGDGAPVERRRAG